MMKKFAVISLLAVSMAACVGPREEVPVASVGKILTPSGFEEGLIQPSSIRLDFCWAWQACDKLVVLETPDRPKLENLQLFMPKDNLNLVFEVRFNALVDPANVEHVFKSVTSEQIHSRLKYIPFDMVYDTYGKPTIRGVVRNVMSKYTISEVMANREAISIEVANAVEKRLQENKSPLKIVRFELANIQPPEIIVKAQEAAAEREIEVQKAEADAKIELTKAERELEVAKKQRLVKRERALALKEENEIAAKVVSPAWLKMRELEVLEKIANSGNSLIIAPGIAAQLGDAAVLSKVLSKELK